MDVVPVVSINAEGVPFSLTTSNPYEQRFGYHRAVRRGPFVFVSGTTAIDKTSGRLQKPGDASAQAALAMEECVSAVEALQGKKVDICRVRMFVARHEDVEAVGSQLKKVFGTRDEGRGVEKEEDQCTVAATMIVVGKGGFVDPEMLVEVEVDAVVLPA